MFYDRSIHNNTNSQVFAIAMHQQQWRNFLKFPNPSLMLIVGRLFFTAEFLMTVAKRYKSAPS